MSSPVYADESDVYDKSGYTSQVVQRVTGKSEAQVTTLINGFLLDAERKVKDAVQVPQVKAFEKHLGTGEDDEFQLGQEDENFYTDIAIENLVEEVKACWFNGTKRKLPFPRDCDEPTDDKDLWDSTGYTQPSEESVIKQAGSYAMKFDWSSSIGTARYPNVSGGVYIDKNIDIYGFMFFRVRSTVANTTITVRLYDSDGNYNEATYLIVKANKWYLVMLDLDEDFTISIDWDDRPLYYLTVTVDKTCIIYLDNLNFNDDWCFTAPSGKLVIMRRSTDEPAPDGYEFTVTYTYDPFKVTIPENIKSATAYFAAADLVEHFIGIRQAVVSFEADTLRPIPDREILAISRERLIKKAEQRLNDYGYGFSGTVVI